MNYIKERFERSKREYRDISEHLDTLKKYADEVDTIVELGVNEGISTTAWALSLEESPKENRWIQCYDYIGPQEYLKPLLKECKDKNLALSFELANDLEIEIPECDILFIDTLHAYHQLIKEFELHANKAKKYIILHDTETFAHRGVDGSEKGLKDALIEFLTGNEIWEEHEHYVYNNGLTILRRK